MSRRESRYWELAADGSPRWMDRRTRLGAGLLLCGWLLGGGACGGDSAPSGSVDGGTVDGGEPCGLDDNNDPATAILLRPGEAQHEVICTRNDADWFRVDVPAGQPILELELTNEAPLTPVVYQYQLFDSAARPIADAEGQDPERGRTRVLLTGRHRVQAGASYYLVIRDDNGTEVDRRNPYRLIIQLRADPDQQEPADRVENRADALSLATGLQTRYLTFRGDVDWFVIEAGPGELIQVTLQMAALATAWPRYSLYLEAESLPFAGGRTRSQQVGCTFGGEGTARIERVHHAPGPGKIYLAVADDAEACGGTGDPEHGYTLSVAVRPEGDVLEGATRNDTPATATIVPEEGELRGARLGSLSDADWYRVPVAAGVSANQPRRLELGLAYSGLPQGAVGNFRPVIQVLQAHMPSACAADADCEVLGGTVCARDTECPGAVCDTQRRRCVGAGSCLPMQRCGVLLGILQPPAVEPGAEQPIPQVGTVLPVTTPGDFFVVVRELQDDDHQAPADLTTYRFTGRLLEEPDPGESDGIWFPWGNSDDPEARVQSARQARSVAPPEVIRDELSGELLELRYPLLEGFIAFAGDQDWFALTLPEEVDGPELDWQFLSDYSSGGGALRLAWTFFNGPDLSPNSGWIGGYREIPPSGRWGDELGECNYLCHKRARPIWLRVAEDLPRRGWDAEHAYRLGLVLKPGCPGEICPCARECPAEE